MKTTLISALVALGWVGLLAVGDANAQYGSNARMAARSSSPDSQAAPAAEAMPNDHMPSPAAQALVAGPPDAPNGAPSEMADGSIMFDNGLWEGAEVGPYCSKCGGGNATPPDWYTQQGVRIISRGKPRRIPISYRSPTQGNFAAVQTDANPATDNFNVLNVSGSTAVEAEAFNTKRLGLDVAAGYDVTLGHYWCRDRNNNDHFVEFTFWGLNSWSDSKTIAGPFIPLYDETTAYTQSLASLINAGLFTPDLSGQSVGSLRTPYPTLLELPGATPAQQTLSQAFNNAIEHDISYRSTMNNFELNGRFSPRGEPDRLVLHPDGKWQRECQPGRYMSYLYGLRFMQIDETFKFHSLSQLLNEGVVAATATGDYDVVTHNDLLGLQIGAEMQFRKCRWLWGVEAKMGPCINFSNQASTITASIEGSPVSDVSQRYVANKYEASLIGQVGFEASYKFRPNLIGRAAYDFMWVTGLALAPEQLQFVADPVNKINVNGLIFSQGLSFGLEWLW